MLTVSGVVVAQEAQVEQVLEKYYFPAKTTLEVLLRNKGFAMEEFMKNTLPRVKTGKVWTLCVCHLPVQIRCTKGSLWGFGAPKGV